MVKFKIISATFCFTLYPVTLLLTFPRRHIHKKSAIYLIHFKAKVNSIRQKLGMTCSPTTILRLHSHLCFCRQVIVINRSEVRKCLSKLRSHLRLKCTAQNVDEMGPKTRIGSSQRASRYFQSVSGPSSRPSSSKISTNPI